MLDVPPSSVIFDTRIMQLADLPTCSRLVVEMHTPRQRACGTMGDIIALKDRQIQLVASSIVTVVHSSQSHTEEHELGAAKGMAVG